jgi:hypothetical protein
MFILALRRSTDESNTKVRDSEIREAGYDTRTDCGGSPARETRRMITLDNVDTDNVSIYAVSRGSCRSADEVRTFLSRLHFA